MLVNMFGGNTESHVDGKEYGLPSYSDLANPWLLGHVSRLEGLAGGGTGVQNRLTPLDAV